MAAVSSEPLGRLSEAPATELQTSVYRPAIAAVDDDAFHDMCVLNMASLVMLAECRILALDHARPIAAGIVRIRAEGRGALPTDPTIEDPYLQFETRLGTIVGEDVAGRLHVGRSRNDLGACLQQMRARRHSLAIAASLNALRTACLAKAAEHVATIMPGYTHLQPAQPITYGFYLASVASALARDARRLGEGYERIDACSLGCAALAGTSFAIDRDRLADLLGFDRLAAPGLDAVASRDFATELLFGATSLATTVSRVAQDFHVFVTHEFSAFDLPDRIAGTSSIMPQKKNPIALEYLRGEAARSIGALTGALTAIKGTNFSICIDAQREGLADLWAALARVPGNLALFTRVIEGASPNAALLLDRCRHNFSTATDLADGLVRAGDLPFREAHHIVGKVVRDAIDAGLAADEITAEMVEAVAQRALGRRIGVDDAFVRSCLDPVAVVAARTTPGGTAPAEVTRMIGECRAALSADELQLAERRERLARSGERLEAAVAALVAGG